MDRDYSGRSRITASIRLVAALWLFVTALMTLVDSRGAADRRDAPMEVLLPFAAMHFALALFMFTGFMTRVAGLLLALISLAEITTLGLHPIPVILGLVGVYMILRGSGAWAMDIYVQMMQDKVRRREAAEAAAAATLANQQPAPSVTERAV